MNWNWNSSARSIFRIAAGILGIWAIIIGSIMTFLRVISWESTIPFFFLGVLFLIVAFRGRIVTHENGRTRPQFKLVAFLVFGFIFILGILKLIQMLFR